MDKHKCESCCGKEPFSAWLIELGSPALWWRGNQAPPYEMWTDDANRAIHFTTEFGAKMELQRLIDLGLKGQLSITDHMFNCGISEGEI